MKILNITLLFLLSFAFALAQQTVDPSGTCPNNSSATIVNGQTDQFLCVPTAPGAATGIWTAMGKVSVKTAYARYNFATDGGAVSTITPASAVNSTIPAKAIVFGVIINSSTAVTSGGAATIAIGTSAGSSAASLRAALAVASYSADAIIAGAPVFTAGSSFKMTAAGQITFTVATAALTAGVIEVWVTYFVAN